MIKKLLPYLKNKFFWVTLAFIIWIVFFDQNNIISQFRLTRSLNDLEKQKEYYLEEIAKNKQAMFELQTDSENLEKYAREKYLMKKDDEEIFIIVDDDEISK